MWLVKMSSREAKIRVSENKNKLKDVKADRIDAIFSQIAKNINTRY